MNLSQDNCQVKESQLIRFCHYYNNKINYNNNDGAKATMRTTAVIITTATTITKFYIFYNLITVQQTVSIMYTHVAMEPDVNKSHQTGLKVQTDSSVISFDRVKIAFIFSFFID